jgi:hypothetical protein
MNQLILRTAGLSLGVLLLVGCGTKVNRVSHDSVIDLSGRWNDTDSRLVAEEMLRDCLSAAWYNTDAAQGKAPTVIVGSEPPAVPQDRSFDLVYDGTNLRNGWRSGTSVEYIGGDGSKI